MVTPEFAVEPLKALIREGYEIAGVFTQPDRPKGRGKKTVPGPVKIAADAPLRRRCFRRHQRSRECFG